MFRGEPKQSGSINKALFEAVCFYDTMDDITGVIHIAVDGSKQLFSPFHLFSLPFLSVSPMSSNPVTFSNRKGDSLPAQEFWDMDWHKRASIFLSQDASVYIYISMHKCMDIYYIGVYVCLKHSAPSLWSGGCTHGSSDWDSPQALSRPLRDFLSGTKGERGLLLCLP